MVDNLPEPYRLLALSPHIHSISGLQLLQYYMLFGACRWDPDCTYSTQLESEKACQLPGRRNPMASHSGMQNWGRVAHCPQDATATSEEVVSECVGGDIHHSFNDQIANVFPFYAFCGALYHLLCWYSHLLT